MMMVVVVMVIWVHVFRGGPNLQNVPNPPASCQMIEAQVTFAGNPSLYQIAFFYFKKKEKKGRSQQSIWKSLAAYICRTHSVGGCTQLGTTVKVMRAK
jgi:hypothetical protein